MEVVKLVDVVNYDDSEKWYNQEVSGTLLEISPEFILVQQRFMRCLIGDGEVLMTVELRTSCMLQQIAQQKNNTGLVKMIISNFQKKGSKIITSETSIIELDKEDVADVVVEYSEEMMFAPVIPCREVGNIEKGVRVSFEGIVVKKELSAKNSDLLLVNVVDDMGHGVKVHLWREAKERMNGICIRQRARFYDWNTTDNNPQFLGGMKAIVSTWSSSCVYGKDMADDVIMIQISDLIGMTNKEYVNGEVTGKVIAISELFKGHNDKDCVKCVIGDANYAVLVVVKDEYAATNIKRTEGTAMKLTVRYFKLSDGVIKTEEFSRIEMSENDIPYVVNEKKQKKILHAPRYEFDELVQLQNNTRVTLGGRVVKMNTYPLCANVTIKNNQNLMVRVTLWRQAKQLADALTIGQRILIYDLKYKDEANARKYLQDEIAPAYSSSTTTIQDGYVEDEDSEETQFVANITGVASKSLVVRVGHKKRILDCSEEMFDTLGNNFPRTETLIVRGQTIVDYVH